MDAWSPRLQQAQEEEKYLCRMKKHMPEKFREMCNMHLAFILNLSDDKLEAILDSDNSSSVGGKRKLTLAPIFRKKVKTSSCLFGSSLSNESICLMTPLIKFLSQKENMSKEGLFRKPGNRQRMRNLREALIAKGPSVHIDTSVYNAYDVSGVLKEFLRDLPEPLLSDRHMEAHRQINALGKHARTSEDHARSVTKRMSALQLLMQLLPVPFSRMTNQVLTLLHDVSNTIETKMTPSTLATIFAPIFFLDRKVSALDVCDAVKEAEPALTFMIENVHKMFKVPKELSVDVINYWKDMEPTQNDSKTHDANGKLSQSYKIRKSISGRTLNTAVCYLDREQSKSVDVASHTQTELDNLFAHVQSLPDTPSNQRIKDLMARRSRTPLSSGGRSKHARSKSIGASIRKIVPSFNKSKTKSLDMSVQSQATPYSDKGLRYKRHNKTFTQCKVVVVDCYSPLAVDSRRQLSGKDSANKNNTSVISDMWKSPAVATLCSTTTTIAHSVSQCTTMTQITPTQSPLNTTIPSQHQTPLTRKRLNTENESPGHRCTPPKQECRNLNVSLSSSSRDKNHTSCLETSMLQENSFNTSSDTIMLSNPVTPVRKHNTSTKLKRSFRSSSLPSLVAVATTPQEIKEVLKSPQITAVESENEISYMPFNHPNKKSSLKSPPCNESPLSSPLTRRPLRPCNVPGTPVMPRAVLRIPRYTFETSL